MSAPEIPLRSLSTREASIFACIADAFVEPAPPFPAIRDTQAVTFIDTWLGRAPATNRGGLRVLLYLCELAPLLGADRMRFRRLPRERRVAFLQRLDVHRLPLIRGIARLGKLTTSLSYYGDRTVMLLCGYDPDAKIAGARELRVREGRP